MTRNELQSYGFMASEYDRLWNERLTIEEQLIFYSRCRKLGLDRLPRHEAVEREAAVRREILQAEF